MPAPAAGLADPAAWTEPATDLDPCAAAPGSGALVCNDGYRWQLAAASFVTPDQCATGTFSAPCASLWAYAGLLVEVVPYGFAEVVSVDGEVVTYRNITMAPSLTVPALTPLRPVPRVDDDHNPASWIAPDDVADATVNSIRFPVFTPFTHCGQQFYRRAFKTELCGIPMAQATEPEMNAGAEILVRIIGTNCMRRMAPPPDTMTQPLLSWSQNKNRPQWVDGFNGNKFVFVAAGAVQQDFVVPGGFTRMQIKAWGGGGRTLANSISGGTAYGGGGGFSSCILDVTPGDAYKIVIAVGSGSGFGFGGASSVTADVRANGTGGGVGGIFTGTGDVTAPDFARAVCLAGGGGGANFSNGSNVNGLGGGDPAAAQPNMQGQASSAGSNGGGGGGGYRGGLRIHGGSSFASGDSQILIPGIARYAVRTNDPDYVPNTGAGDQPGAVVIIMIP